MIFLFESALHHFPLWSESMASSEKSSDFADKIWTELSYRGKVPLRGSQFNFIQRRRSQFHLSPRKIGKKWRFLRRIFFGKIRGYPWNIALFCRKWTFVWVFRQHINLLCQELSNIVKLPIFQSARTPQKLLNICENLRVFENNFWLKNS